MNANLMYIANFSKQPFCPRLKKLILYPKKNSYTFLKNQFFMFKEKKPFMLV